MKLYRSILSVSFAFLVLFSSSSFMIGIHVCGGKIQNMALFTKAEGCENKKQLPPCHRHEKQPCCQDETILHDAQDFNGNILHINTTSLLPVGDISQPPVLIAEVIPSSIISKTRYTNYDPPLRSHDLTIALQVFLI